MNEIMKVLFSSCHINWYHKPQVIKVHVAAWRRGNPERVESSLTSLDIESLKECHENEVTLPIRHCVKTKATDFVVFT
jgi:hypothetical protein